MKMDDYVKKLSKIRNDFEEEYKPYWNEVRKLINSKLDISTRVYPCVSEDTNGYQKLIMIDLIKDDVDHRKITIDFNEIKKDIDKGVSFTDAVYKKFVDILMYHPELIEVYKGNIWEKLIDCFLSNTNIKDISKYYINNDHTLIKKADSIKDYEPIAYFDDIEHIEFIGENEVIIYCGEDEDFQKIVINDNGVQRFNKEGVLL